MGLAPLKTQKWILEESLRHHPITRPNQQEANKELLAEKEAAEEANKALLAEKEAAEEANKELLAEKEAAEEANKALLAEKEAAEEANKELLAWCVVAGPDRTYATSRLRNFSSGKYFDTLTRAADTWFHYPMRVWMLPGSLLPFPVFCTVL